MPNTRELIAGRLTWWEPSNDISAASQLNGDIKVTRVVSTSAAFAALRADGSVVT